MYALPLIINMCSRVDTPGITSSNSFIYLIYQQVFNYPYNRYDNNIVMRLCNYLEM